MCTSRCGSLNGNGRRKRSSIRLRIEVFKPIPSARVMTAMTVNPGDLRSCRNAKRNSFMIAASLKVCSSFRAQRDDRIDMCGAARGQPAGKQRRGEKQHADAEINPRVDVANFKKHSLQRARYCDRAEQTNSRSNQ